VLLEDRVAIVSGIGPGVGRSVAVAFAREGANVVLGTRSEERLAEVAAEVEAVGAKTAFRPTDVRKEEDCRALAETAVEAFGGVDVLVNNAFWHGPIGEMAEMPPDMWRKAFETNVLGSLAMTRAVVPSMTERGGGSVVMVNTLAARQGYDEEAPYAASKGALLTTARSLARNLGPHGIRVNSVLPGPIWGPSLEWWYGELAKERGVTPDVVYTDEASRTSLQRIPTSDEVAAAVLFFASDLSKAVTGQTLDVNAGSYFD
jgi:NAD(P)-dependent dehydrogenase (short-subunit alcohol dehydrogenase family)